MRQADSYYLYVSAAGPVSLQPTPGHGVKALLSQGSMCMCGSLHTDMQTFQKRDFCSLQHEEQLPSYLSRMIGV